MTIPILTATAAEAELTAAPIVPDWIMAGTPQASCKAVGFSEDRTSYIMIWECTPGRFRWHYGEDETVVLVSGELFLTMENGQERRLVAGDVAFFPAGSTCIWRITKTVRKVAVLRKTMSAPIGLLVRIWSKLTRILGRLNPRVERLSTEKVTMRAMQRAE